jgi:hypothetical protein
MLTGFMWLRIVIKDVFLFLVSQGTSTVIGGASRLKSNPRTQHGS